MAALTRPPASREAARVLSAVLVLGCLTTGAAVGNGPDSGALLTAFAERLRAEPPGEDLRRVALQQEAEAAAMTAKLTIRQSSSLAVDGSGALDLGLGASLAIPLYDPGGVANAALARHRLELARHNQASDRRARLEEFWRTLRLLAHLEEVEGVLGRYRSEMLDQVPGLSQLESGPLPLLGPTELSYLELAQAWSRARGERELLAGLVKQQAGLPDDAGLAQVGRPPAVTAPAAAGDCRTAGDEESRALLVLEEASLEVAARQADLEPVTVIDIAGDVSYSTGARGALNYRTARREQPWVAGVRVSLRTRLPRTLPLNGQLGIEWSESGLRQEFNLSWPPGPAVHFPDLEAARQEYARSAATQRITMERLSVAVEHAEGHLRLKEAVFDSARTEAEARAAGVAGPSHAALAQAQIALLSAQLELDLANLQLAFACGDEVDANLQPSG